MRSNTPHGIPFIARPAVVVAVPACLYLLLCLPVGIALLSEARGTADGGFVLGWTLVSIVPGFVGALAGLVASGRARMLANRTLRNGTRWVVAGALTFLGAHWLPLLLSTPLVLSQILFDGPTDRLLSAAGWGLVPWAVFVAVLFSGEATRRSFQKPSVGDAGAGSGAAYRILAAALVAGTTAPLVLGVMVAVAAGGDGQSLGIPAFLVVGGVGALAGVGLGWSTATARGLAFPQVRGLWDRTFRETLGAFLILLSGCSLFATTWPIWGQALGQRFGLQIAFTMVLALGVGMLSVHL